jgi:hypothetical protein
MEGNLHELDPINEEEYEKEGFFEISHGATAEKIIEVQDTAANEVPNEEGMQNNAHMGKPRKKTFVVWSFF